VDGNVERGPLFWIYQTLRNPQSEHEKFINTKEVLGDDYAIDDYNGRSCISSKKDVELIIADLAEIFEFISDTNFINNEFRRMFKKNGDRKWTVECTRILLDSKLHKDTPNIKFFTIKVPNLPKLLPELKRE